MKYQITVPLPPKAVSPNARGHWGKRARAVKAYRSACELEYRRRRPPTIEKPVRIHLDFYLAREPQTKDRYFPKDADNARASFKAGQDALVDAGIITSDSKKFLQLGETRLHTRKKEHQGRCCVVVTLEAMD